MVDDLGIDTLSSRSLRRLHATHGIDGVTDERDILARAYDCSLAQDVVLTAVGGNCDGVGDIRTVVFYRECEALDENDGKSG